MAVIGSVVQRLERGSYKAQKKVRFLPDPLINKYLSLVRIQAGAQNIV